MNRQYQQVRCEECNARLFDTSAQIADQDEANVEVLIRCWRCKTICVVYLAGPEAVAEGVLYSA